MLRRAFTARGAEATDQTGVIRMLSWGSALRQSVVGMAVLLAVGVGSASAAVTATATFSNPGAYTFTVPSGVTSITATVIGAAGGGGCAAGGKGASLTATVPVTSGEQLAVGVAAPGQPCGDGQAAPVGRSVRAEAAAPLGLPALAAVRAAAVRGRERHRPEVPEAPPGRAVRRVQAGPSGSGARAERILQVSRAAVAVVEAVTTAVAAEVAALGVAAVAEGRASPARLPRSPRPRRPLAPQLR